MYRRTLRCRPALALVALAALLCGPAPARADESTPSSTSTATPAPSPAAAEMLKSMREHGILSQKEYEKLYRRQARYEAEQRAQESLPGWLRDWTFGGDLRLRWERQDFGHVVGPGQNLIVGKDNVDAVNGTVTGVRDRYLLRLRIGAEKRLGDGVTFGFRIATSSSTEYAADICAPECGIYGTSLVGDPRSANATMGGFFTPKNVYLDRAYLVWQPSFAKTFRIVGGKFANPFLSDNDPADRIIWDPDINPEGAAAQYRFDFIPRVLWFDSTAAYFFLKEIASATIKPISLVPLTVGATTQTFRPHYSERDPYMYGIQGGLTMRPSEWWKLGARASYYDVENVDATLVAALNDLGNGGDAVEHNPLLVVLGPGNPLATNGASQGRIEEDVASGFVTFMPFGPRYALTPFYQWSSITNAQAQNQAWAAGVDFGAPDLFKLTVMYANVQRNGTIALFTDSDLFGGVTNAKGWYATLERQLTPSLRFEATVSKSRISQEKCAFSGVESVLCDTNSYLNQFPDLAAAYNKTRRHRLLIMLDLIGQF